ncbi:MAG: hypothetical protein OXS33_01445 [bacterium]|nr:hypothetical protein [bacterium]
MNSALLRKVTGWLLIIGPLVDVLANILRPGSFPSEHPDGPQATLQAMVQDSAANPTMVHLLVDVEFFAALGLLLGFWGVSRVMGDTDKRGFLRKYGMLLFGVAIAVRTAGVAMGFVMALITSYIAPGAPPGALDTAVMFLVMEGALAVFATILIVLGIALFAVSMTDTGLIGADKPLAYLLAVIPAVVATILLLMAPLVEGNLIAMYAAGNVASLIPVAWMVLLGLAFIRKSDALPATS